MCTHRAPKAAPQIHEPPSLRRHEPAAGSGRELQSQPGEQALHLGEIGRSALVERLAAQQNVRAVTGQLTRRRATRPSTGKGQDLGRPTQRRRVPRGREPRRRRLLFSVGLQQLGFALDPESAEQLVERLPVVPSDLERSAEGQSNLIAIGQIDEGERRGGVHGIAHGNTDVACAQRASECGDVRDEIASKHHAPHDWCWEHRLQPRWIRPAGRPRSPASAARWQQQTLFPHKLSCILCLRWQPLLCFWPGSARPTSAPAPTKEWSGSDRWRKRLPPADSTRSSSCRTTPSPR